MKNKKNLLCILLTIVMVVSVFIPLSAAEGHFTDVDSSHWAFDLIEAAAVKGYISGVGDKQFAPDRELTNAEFVAMITRVYYGDMIESYTYTFGQSDTWWEPYMETASLMQCLNGTSVWYPRNTDNFEWDSQVEQGISRFDMAQIIYNIMVHEKVPLPSSQQISLAESSIADWDSIPDNYRDAVVSCFAAGMLSGTDSKGTFNGNGIMTRAQAAVVLCRMTGIDMESVEQPAVSTGGRDSDGYTLASSVNSIRPSIEKSDSYKTKGSTDTISSNGYYTGADVEIGNATLVYDFLEMVNESRKTEGLSELAWVPSDAAEEYTLLRAYDMLFNYSHDRDKGIFSLEVLGKGYRDAEAAFQGWMESSGHYETLMDESVKYLCGTLVSGKVYNYWVITVWRDQDIINVNKYSADNYVW